MPRTYNMGQRAAPKADTRARIVAAALVIYRDRGLAGASNLAIARAADVAPATVRNHFPEPGQLAMAVFEALLVELRIPTPAIFDGLGNLRDRVERLARELAAFYERSEPWWRAYEREPELISGMERWRRPVLRRHRSPDAGGPRRAVGRRAVGRCRGLCDRAASVLRPPGAGPLVRRSRSAEPRAHASLARAAPGEPREVATEPPDTRTIAAMTRVALP